MFKVQGIDHVGLAVKDVRKSVEWYQEILGLERLFEDVWGDFPGVVDIGDTSVAFSQPMTLMFLCLPAFPFTMLPSA
jgi:catechol 2,3-dioxygenase-like lactoylglutathione lyase family enzyme